MAYNTNTDRLLDRSKKGIEESLGRCGGQLLTGNSPVTGTFRAIQAIAETTVTTVGSLQVTSLTIPAGIVLYGEFTSVTAGAANTLIVYNAC